MLDIMDLNILEKLRKPSACFGAIFRYLIISLLTQFILGLNLLIYGLSMN